MHGTQVQIRSISNQTQAVAVINDTLCSPVVEFAGVKAGEPDGDVDPLVGLPVTEVGGPDACADPLAEPAWFPPGSTA